MATSPPTLTLSADQSEVKAGGTILLTAVLAQSGSEQTEYALSVRGVDAAWVTLVPETLSVAAGGQATATILLAPPVGAAAGDLVLTVRAAGDGPNAAAEARFSIRLSSTTAAPTGKARTKKRSLAWPQVLMIAVGVLMIAGAVGVFAARHRHTAPPPQRTADCTSESSKVVDLYSDDATTAIRISDGDPTDVRILRTEPADTLSPLFSSLLALSPDGSHLAYVTASNEGLDNAHLWSLDVANPAQRQEIASVPRGLWLVRPSWSPDNRHVAFLRVNEQQAAASQSQLELWIGDVGGQAHKVASPPELRPDGFYGAATQPLCWAQDNQSVIFSSVTRTSSPTDQGTRATGAGQASAVATDPGVPRQIAVDVTTGTTEELAFPLTASDAVPTVPAAPPGGANCGLPVFSQNDPAWRNVIMQSSGDTIGRFGCAVTATAMLLNYYGTTVTPAQLNTCLGDKADLISWASVVPCANGAVTASNAFDFSWPSLDQVLASGNPAIVGMVRGQTGLHFVVVTAGGGGEATDYAVIDPWDGTTTKTLQTFLDSGYNPRWIRTYTGTERACPRLVATPTPAADATGVVVPSDGPLLVPAQLVPFFAKVADQTGVPRELLMALARIESGFTPRATGPLIERFNGTEDAHALGMMQFLPSTYRTFSAQVDKAIAPSASAGTYHVFQAGAPARSPLGDAGIWDPEASIWAAAFFLQQNDVATDPRKALFAYNNADWYVDLVLKTAQQYKMGAIPDANLYDPNSPSKPGTLAAPNPLNPPPLPASEAVPSPAKQAGGGQAGGGGAAGSSGAPGGAGGGATGNGGSGSGGSGAAGSGSGGSGSGGSGNASSSGAGSSSGGAGGSGQSGTSATVPIKWSFTEGSISRTEVHLDINSSDNIGQVQKFTLNTLSTPGAASGGFNQPTPSRPITPGMVVSDDGVYEAVIVTRQGNQTRTSRRKFTIDRTPPSLDVSVIGSGGGTTGGFGATQAVKTGETTRQVANGAIRLKIGYSDPLSGVSSVEYRIDGGDWQLYFNAVAFKGEAQIDVPGDHTVDVRATDVAGNVSAERSLDFTVVNSSAVAGEPPSLKPVTTTVGTTAVATIVALAPAPTGTSAANAAATSVAATVAATTTAPTVAVSPPASPGATSAVPAATITATIVLPTITPTVVIPTLVPTPTAIRGTNTAPVPTGIVAISNTASTATTTTATSATATPVVTPTVAVTATAVTATPSASATIVQQLSNATATPTVAATATATNTPTPSLTVKIVPPVCPDMKVDGTVACTPIILTNAGTTDLTINGINIAGDFVLTGGSTCTGAINPSATCQIPLSFKPTTGGARAGSLTITDSAPDSPQTLTLSGIGVGASAVAFAPSLFACPDTEIGSVATCTITVTNTGTAALTIANGMTTTGDFALDPANTDCGLTLARASFCRLSVAFAPTVRGTRTGVITVNDSASGSPHTIPLNGRGLAPVVQFSTAVLKCFDTDVGGLSQCSTGSDPKNVVNLKLTNTGDGPLRINSVFANGDYKVDPTACNAAAVDPNKSCELPVFFTPTVHAKLLTGSLTIFDNAIGQTQSLQLEGKGTAPVVTLGPGPPTVNPVSITCPDTIVGQLAVCTEGPITITNLGDSDLRISSIVPFDDFVKVTNTNCSTVLRFVPDPSLPPTVNQCFLEISFAPIARGLHRSGIAINDNAVGSPHTAQILGKAIAPVVSLSASSISCPPTIVGTPRDGNGCGDVTLTNVGDSPLNISSVVPADDFIRVSTAACLTPLPIKGICTLPISFVPSARGTFVSGLTITDDAQGSPQSVQINAKAIAPVVSLSASSISCPPTIVGTPRDGNGCGDVTLTNVGDSPLNISSVVPADDFIRVATAGCGPTVAVQGTCTLPISFSPFKRGTFASSVAIADDAPGSPQTVQVTAKGLQPIVSLTPAAITCPDTAVGQTTTLCTPSPITLTNSGDAPLNIGSIVPSIDFSLAVAPSATNCGAALDPGASCALQLTFSPTIAGAHQGSVAFVDDAPGSPHAVQVTAKALAPVVSLSASSFVCPDTIVGQIAACAPATITLANTGDADLSISSIVPASDFLKVTTTGCPAIIHAGANCALPVSFAPSVRGQVTSGLTIIDNALGSPHGVQMIGKGLAPVVSLSTLAVACPDTIVGQSAVCGASNLTLNNTGDAPLIVSSVVPADDFIKVTVPAACGNLLPGQNCALPVSFAPTSRGTHVSGLAFTDNAPGSPHSVQYTGRGLAPVVTLSATTVACPDTIVGQLVACNPAAITLTNDGDAPLNIGSIAPADDFIRVATAGCGPTVAVHDTCTLPISFSPFKRGTFASSVAIADDAAGSPQTVQVTAKGLAPVATLSAPSLTCPDTVVGTSTTACTPATITFTNSGDAPLNIGSIVPSVDFSVRVAPNGTNCGAALAPSASCALQVTFAPTITGTHEGSIAFVDDAPGSPHAVQVTAKALAPVVSLSASNVACPDTIVGQSAVCGSSVLSLSNTGDAPLNISSIVPTDDFIKVTITGCAAVLPAGQNCTLPVSFAPIARGSHVSGLTITDNALGSPHSVQFTGRGLAPVVSLSATAVTCPATIVGQSAPCGSSALTLANSGDAPLNVSSITPGNDFIKVTVATACGTIAAGQICTLPISFAPTARGNFTSGLTIVDDAAGSPHAVQITATGQAPVVSLSASSIACPATIVGQTASCGASALTLANTGDAPLSISSIVPGDDFIKVNVGGCPATLPAGQNCALPISYVPLVRGPFTSGLTIVDNAAGSPHAVQLTGSALAPVLALGSTTASCPDTIVGQSSACTPQPLTLTNTGDAPLNIGSIAPADDFSLTAGTGCGATIAQGVSCQLQVTFTPKTRGDHTSGLTIVDNAPGSPHAVQLTGKATAPIVALSATSVTCPTTPVGQTGAACTPASVTLTNSGDAPLTIGSIAATDDFTAAPPSPACGTTVAPNGTCVLQIAFAPKSAGNHTGSIAVADNAPGSPHAVQLTGVGLAPVISLSTQSVACGGTPVGGTVTCPVFALGNTGTGALTISSIVMSGDFTAAITPSCNTAVQPTDTCQITVTFGPTAAGSRSGSLTIADNAPGSPHAVALTGTGQAPVVSLSASSLACPDTAVGQTANCTAPVTLTNSGDAPLAISSIVPSDDFKAAAAQCPATLAAAAQCQIAVTFAPGSAGNHVGALTITDSAGGSPHAVQLTGTGLAPVVTLSTQSITCTGTLVGTTATCPVVTLTNTGTTALKISSVVMSGDFVATISSNCGTSVAPTVVCQITTTFGPTAAGSRTGSLTITDNAAGSPHAIALLGTGQAPALSLSPATVSCPDTAVGATVICTTPVTLTNSGDAALTLSSIAATDDFHVSAPAVGQACGTTLAPNGTCALQVSFSPTTAGSHAGNVTVIDNAAGSPHAVQFTGNALAPAVTLSAQAVSCPDTLIGSTNTCPQVALSNTGTSPLTWTGITANSPYSVAATTCGTSLSPGATCQITVSFAPGTFGNQTGFLTIADNAGGSPHKVPLSGNGIGTPALTVTPAVNCPDTAVTNPPTTAACTTLVTVANGSAGTGNLVISQITIGSEFAIDSGRSTCGTILTPGNNCVLAIIFTPALDGQRTGTLTITDNAPGSPHAVTLSGKGLGTPGISLSTTALSCPDTPVQTTASCPTRITITNPGTAQLNLTQVAITGNEFALDTLTNSTCGTAVAPGASCALAISFTPSASGARSGSVRLTDNGPSSPQTVTLSGTGTQAVVALSPTAITCPDTVIGASSICSLTVTNSGNGTLNMSTAITAGGSDYVIDTSGGGSCGATLAGGASCTLSVKFTPTATGTRPGTLVMTDNAAGSPRSIPLSGNGTQPAVTLSTTSVSCSDTQYGTKGACQQVTLRNTGTASLTITPPLVTTDVFGTDLANTTCGTTVAVGASCSIILTFAPTATPPGVRTGTLRITDNAPDSPQLVNLTGTGVAAAPALTATPASSPCTAAAVGTSGTCAPVTLKNTGLTPMNLTVPFPTAGDFAVDSGSSTCTSTLLSNATCTLVVTFTPVVTGARNGTATIAYSASAGSQTLIVVYRGTGT